MTQVSERDLYRPVMNLLKRHDYTVEKEFSVWSETSGISRDVDLIGFKWRGGVDVWAVEVKRGSGPVGALFGLPQAVEYQLVASKVSVAAQCPKEDLRHARAPLRAMGLGYIYTTPHRAHIVFRPQPEARLEHSAMPRAIRHAGALVLLQSELKKMFDEPIVVHSGGWVRRRGRKELPVYDDLPWGCHVYPNRPVQIGLGVWTDPGSVYARIWVERKGALRRVLRRIDIDSLHDALQERGLVAYLSRRRRRAYGPLEPTQVAERMIGDSRRRSRAALTWALGVLERPWEVPVLRVDRELWPYNEEPVRVTARKSLRAALRELRPIHRMLDLPPTARIARRT